MNLLTLPNKNMYKKYRTILMVQTIIMTFVIFKHQYPNT